MTTVTQSSNSKICVTCAYYVGERIPQRAFIRYESDSRGKCMRPPCPTDGYTKMCSQNCGFWRKWEALR